MDVIIVSILRIQSQHHFSGEWLNATVEVWACWENAVILENFGFKVLVRRDDAGKVLKVQIEIMKRDKGELIFSGKSWPTEKKLGTKVPNLIVEMIMQGVVPIAKIPFKPQD